MEGEGSDRSFRLKRGDSQVKVAWSKSRIGDLEFFRVWGEHEARMEGGRTWGEREEVTGGRRESERGWSHLISPVLCWYFPLRTRIE